MLAVLAKLADGIDPASGTAFPADSPYQHPETVRALFLAIRRLDAAGSASVLPAAGSASVLPAAGSTQTSNATAPSTPTEASPVGRKPSASSTAGKDGNAGKAWTPEEDQRLAAAFDAGEDIGALTKAHGRSRLALEIRLAKLGRLPMPEKTLYGNKLQPTERPQSAPPADIPPADIPPADFQPADVRTAKARSTSAPRRASESGGLRYHVGKSIAAAGLRI